MRIFLNIMATFFLPLIILQNQCFWKMEAIHITKTLTKHTLILASISWFYTFFSLCYVKTWNAKKKVILSLAVFWSIWLFYLTQTKNSWNFVLPKQPRLAKKTYRTEHWLTAVHREYRTERRRTLLVNIASAAEYI